MHYIAVLLTRLLFFQFLVLHVLMPNGAYSGQKLMKFVSRKTPLSTSSTSPSVPLMVPVKYKTAIITAKTVRTRRSVFPMFFFMIVTVLGY